MGPRSETLIGTLVTACPSRGISRRNPVFFWKGYGFVCPSLLTTNGVFSLLRKKLLQEVCPNHQKAIQAEIGPDYEAHFENEHGQKLDPAKTAAHLDGWLRRT